MQSKIQNQSRRDVLSSAGAFLGIGLLPGAVEMKPLEDQGGGPFSVKKFGASGKRSDNATTPFRKAIEACAAAGGGTVNVTPGEYTVGTVKLLDNVTLHVDAGATLFLSQQKTDFIPDTESLIFAQGAKNIGITGKGTINGLAQYEFTEMHGVDPEISKEIEIARAAGIDIRRYYRSRQAMNVFLVVLNDCSNVNLNGISLINSPLWTVRLNDCDQVNIHNVYIYSDLEKGVNADGVDICSSRNVTISDSLIITGDDCIVLKAIARNNKPANPVENITVTNCILSSSSTPLMIGTETEADIHHVIFNNCVVRNSNKGFGINVQDGAVVSNVIFSNLTIETNRRHWNWWGDSEMCKFVLKKRTADSRLGRIRDIFVDNVIVMQRGTSTITGHTDQPLENIRMTNIQLRMDPEDAKDKRATDAIRIESVKGLRLRDVAVQWNDDQPEPRWQSALVLKNVSDFAIESFKGRQGLKGRNFPAIALEDVYDGSLLDTTATEGTETFIHVKGNKVKDVLIKDTNSRKAKKAFTAENEEVKKRVDIVGG